MQIDTIRSCSYNQASPVLRHKIAAMLNEVWPDDPSAPKEIPPQTHAEYLHAQAFYCCKDGEIISYAAVLCKTICYNKLDYHIAGLSCVATHPDYRGMGFGGKTVAAATRWIAQQNEIDFGIFTCAPTLADFYNYAGHWLVQPKVVLIGNREDGALSSASLGVVVLMRLFSEKAKAHEGQLRCGTISLDFPVGQFL